jgi:abhydrolase domain-containing protein 17
MVSKAQLRKLLIGDFTWRRLLRSSLFVYGCFLAFAWFRADSIIFATPAPSYSDDSALQTLGERSILKIPVNDQEKISAMHLVNPQATYTLLYIHGNGGDLGHNRSLIQGLHNRGFSVFAYDYRGYGTSDGSASEQNAYQDAVAAYRYLTETLKVPANRIILHGRSLGGASAVDLAMQKPVAGLIMESSFYSAFRVVVPVPILPFEKFHSVAKLPLVKCPVLIIHGDLDKTVPIAHGRKLYDVAPQPKRFLWVPNGEHVDLDLTAGVYYDRALQDFQTLIKNGENPETR